MLTNSRLNVGAVLNRLGINYRELPCMTGVFYYCKNPVNGISFDIKIGEDGIIRLWSFIGTAPVSKAGRRYEHRASKYPYAVVGLEVTDEGDISFYAEQKIDITDSRSVARIDRIIRGYINLITDSSLALVL